MPSIQEGQTGLHSLPTEIFLSILEDLDPEDLIHCRLVSKLWFNVFARSNNLYFYLRSIYPLAREVKGLEDDDNNGLIGHFINAKVLKAFDRVASRYFYLARGKPHSVKKFPILPVQMDHPYGITWPIVPWTLHMSYPHGSIDCNIFASTWTYDDGILVMLTREEFLLLLDLEAKKSSAVPFSTFQKVVRNIRLNNQLLVIEWSESHGFYDTESSHIIRHFASVYDVEPFHTSGAATLRSEWELLISEQPFVGRERFYSSHNRNHYVLYSWQQNRSPFTAAADAPIECLTIWDISKPCQSIALSYSNGPSEKDNSTPRLVARFDFRMLEFYSIRHGGTPSIIKLDIDSQAGVVDFIENRAVTSVTTGPIATDMAFFGSTRITSIPFISQGPCWKHDIDASYPPYRGTSSLNNRALPANEKNSNLYVSEIVDDFSQVRFSLRFRPPGDSYPRVLEILVNTPLTNAVMATDLSNEIGSHGKICGDERFLVGENSNSEVVIYYFS